MALCPVCEHPLEASLSCPVCGLEVAGPAAVGAPAPADDGPLPDLEPTLLPPALAAVAEVLPGLESQGRDASGPAAGPLPDWLIPTGEPDAAPAGAAPPDGVPGAPAPGLDAASAVLCRSCRTPVVPGERFCERCGLRAVPLRREGSEAAASPSRCRFCGAIVPGGGRCPACGARAAEAGP